MSDTAWIKEVGNGDILHMAWIKEEEEEGHVKNL